MPATLPGPRSPDSAARLWAPLAGFAARDERLGAWARARGPVWAGFYEFLRFGVKQGWACLFGGALCGLLILTHLVWPAGAPLARYDAMTLAAIGDPDRDAGLPPRGWWRWWRW